jgi:SAM-dependent methyltransferase
LKLQIKKYWNYFVGLFRIYFIRRFEYLWKHYNILRSRPRRCLEYGIFPHFYAHEEFKDMLFIGVSSCTEHYDEYFKNKTFYTIDIDPERARYGSKKRHIIDSAENITKYFKDGSLDAVIMNGVYGWGLDDDKTLIKTIEGIKRILRPGGVFVFGWDKVPKYDPIDIDGKNLFGGFSSYSILGKTRIELKTKHRHIYCFYQKPAEAKAR